MSELRIDRTHMHDALSKAHGMRPREFHEFARTTVKRNSRYETSAKHSVSLNGDKYSSKALFAYARHLQESATGENLPNAHPGPVVSKKLTISKFLFNSGVSIDSHNAPPPDEITLKEIEAHASKTSDENRIALDERARGVASVLLRPEQFRFRVEIRKAYDDRCAISGCSVLDALEAAHIIPFKHAHSSNDVQNGLLLRADLHKLFDLGLLTADPDTFEINLAPSIRNSFYRRWHGKLLRRRSEGYPAPSTNALRQHMEWARQREDWT